MLSIWLEVASEVKERRRANTAHRNLRPPSLHGQAAELRRGLAAAETSLKRLQVGLYFQEGACLHLVIISQLLSDQAEYLHRRVAVSHGARTPKAAPERVGATCSRGRFVCQCRCLPSVFSFLWACRPCVYTLGAHPHRVCNDCASFYTPGSTHTCVQCTRWPWTVRRCPATCCMPCNAAT